MTAGAVSALTLSTVMGTAASASPADSTSDPSTDTAVRTSVDNSRAIVQLSLAPLTTSPRTKPAPGKKLDFSSATTKSERARLAAQRNQFKRWLRSVAPKAKVTGEFDISVNALAIALNGTALSVLEGGPGVVSVSYEGTYRPLDSSDPDLGLISAIQAWAQAGGPAAAGAGVKVAIVDSGIDQAHPCFDGTGYPAFTGSAGDSRFTNSKVVVAKVFNMRARVRSYTAEAVDSHGTHVAGTVACELDTPATVDGVAIPYAVSGVAPAAQLGNYNVFPGDVEDARSEDILNALDAAVADGMDVVNMSLGGVAHGVQDLLTVAVDNLDRANIVVAVSNGNEGPGHFTVSSPGSAARALSAGASSVPHFVGLPLTVGAASYLAATGEFAVPPADLTAPLQAVLVGTTLEQACAALPAGSLAGRIALVSRGTCSFSTKIRNAQAAGAVAAVVVNNVAGDPTAMASDGTPDQPTIPAVMVSLADRAALVAASGQSATLGSSPSYALTTNANIMAGFSSQGPTDVDFRVKPDLVAPGVNVLSSVPGDCGTGGCWAFFSGTSMASPHLAGMSAVVRGDHPSWSAEQVRSAIVNTADQGVLTGYQDGTTVVTDVNIVGAGMANLLSAVGASIAVGPVSTSFGAVPSGSGQSLTKLVRLTNISSAALVLDLSVAGDAIFSVGAQKVTLAAGQSVDVPVTVALAKQEALGDRSGELIISTGGVQVAHSVLYVFVK